MSSKKHTPQQREVPQGRWLYDFIMRGIEPELLQTEEELESQYKGETVISYAARMERYERAFKEFDHVLSLITGSLMEGAQREKKKRRAAAGMEEERQKIAEGIAAENSLRAFSTDI